MQNPTPYEIKVRESLQRLAETFDPPGAKVTDEVCSATLADDGLTKAIAAYAIYCAAGLVEWTQLSAMIDHRWDLVRQVDLARARAAIVESTR